MKKTATKHRGKGLSLVYLTALIGCLLSWTVSCSSTSPPATPPPTTEEAEAFGGDSTATSKVATKPTKPAQGSGWEAPAAAKKRSNPLDRTADVLSKGEQLFATACAPCHGTEGKGDGPTGGALTPKPADLTTARVQQQSDGALFWKVSHGKSPMPAFGTAYSNKQIWAIVSYVKTLNKSTAFSKRKK